MAIACKEFHERHKLVEMPRDSEFFLYTKDGQPFEFRFSLNLQSMQLIWLAVKRYQAKEHFLEGTTENLRWIPNFRFPDFIPESMWNEYIGYVYEDCFPKVDEIIDMDRLMGHIIAMLRVPFKDHDLGETFALVKPTSTTGEWTKNKAAARRFYDVFNQYDQPFESRHFENEPFHLEHIVTMHRTLGDHCAHELLSSQDIYQHLVTAVSNVYVYMMHGKLRLHFHVGKLEKFGREVMHYNGRPQAMRYVPPINFIASTTDSETLLRLKYLSTETLDRMILDKIGFKDAFTTPSHFLP